MKQLVRVLLVMTLILAMAVPAFAAAADGAAAAEDEFVESITEKPEVDPDDIKPDTPQKPGDDEDLYDVNGDGIPGGDKNLNDPNAKPSTPKTGDESNPVLWGGVCLVSLAGLLAMLKSRKRA